MARRSSIIALGLEEVLIKARKKRLGLDKAVDACNRHLATRHKGDGDPPVVHRSAVQRYYANLDKATTPDLHTPAVTAENAVIAVNIADDFRLVHGKLKDWLQEVETPQPVFGKDGEVTGEEINWPARTAVAREFRESLKLWADMSERIYNMEQVDAFQKEVMLAVREADPETAERIRVGLKARQSIVRAALLGA